MNKTIEKTHAERNAEGHAASILEMYRAYTELEGGAESATVNGYQYNDSDSIRGMAMDCALYVVVRTPWYTLGDRQEPDEFCILLTTDGPALRIHGELDGHGQPDVFRSDIEIQERGTP